MLTSKQRAKLRSMASTLDTIMQIGKNGITDTLVATVGDALEAHELIKLRVLETCDLGVRGAAEELADAQKAIAKLGGQVREVIPYTVAGGGERSLIVIEKAEKTPAGYPRRFSKIKSSPIK